MTESPRRRSLTTLSERLTPWLPLLNVPVYLALFGLIWQQYGAMTTVEAKLSQRLGLIENTRFTREQWIDFTAGPWAMVTSDLAVIKHQLDALEIPPKEVKQSLATIERRLVTIEQDLRRALSPPGSSP